MYQLKPITERVKKMREKYRDTKPEICTSRYRLITEFYMNNPDMTGIIKRAKNFKNICENIAIRIDEGEVIVGAQSSKYRACALYPENSVNWLKEELESGYISTRDIDPYIVSEEDREYILSTIDFWMKECMSAITDAAIVDEYKAIALNGVLLFGPRGQTASPWVISVRATIRPSEKALPPSRRRPTPEGELVDRGCPLHHRTV
jgi:formate C-acetyltransferase